MRPLPRLMVAPNGARHGKADHPALPITIEETVAAARACHATGADGLHAHVRDATGTHVLDAGLYRELLSEMARVVPSMVVQVTTESVGRYSPAEQRALVADLRPAEVSVALREMLQEDDPVATRDFYHGAEADGIAVQHILYNKGDAMRLVHLVEQGVVPPAPRVLIVLGQYHVRAAEPSDLTAPLAALVPLGEVDWAACAFGPKETACLVAAHSAGGKLRVGFENNFYNTDGRIAGDNAARVAEVVRATSTG